MRTGIAITAVTAALALTVSACSAGASGGSSSQSRDDIVVAQTAEPANLDFTTTSGAAIPQALMENVYESLVKIDQDGSVQPALAESWEVSDDRTEYTFKLREGVTFSSGADFTADDVVYSYERVNSDAWTNALKSKMAVIDSVEADGDYSVKITLKKPSNRWLFDLASLVGAVFDEDGTDDLANTAVGTGPYSIEKFTRGQEIVYTKRDDYWGDAPALETVSFKYFKDSVAAANALKSGEVDVLANLQAPDLLGDFESDSEQFQVSEGTSNGEVVLSMNNAEGIFKDQKVREAVMQAVDRQAVIDTAWAGHGTLIGSMVPPTDPYHEDLNNVWPYDVEAAKKLIKEAGAEGEEFTFTVPNLPYAQAISNVIVAQLEEIGLKPQVETQEFPAVWLENTFTNHDYDMSVVNHVEARDILTVFGEGYYTGYDASRIEGIAQKADEGTEQEYIDGMKEVARTITEDAAADFLFLFPNLVVADAQVTGIAKNQVSDSFPISQLSWK